MKYVSFYSKMKHPVEVTMATHRGRQTTAAVEEELHTDVNFFFVSKTSFFESLVGGKCMRICTVFIFDKEEASFSISPSESLKMV